jgi:hypothetical protein
MPEAQARRETFPVVASTFLRHESQSAGFGRIFGDL